MPALSKSCDSFIYEDAFEVALSTMVVSEMSGRFTIQGPRLGCAMGEVGGQQGGLS